MEQTIGSLVRLIENSELFDPEFYKKQFEVSLPATTNLAEHYLTKGWTKGADPSDKFSTLYYLEEYDDIKAANLNPLVHYILHGKKENRRILSPAKFKRRIAEPLSEEELSKLFNCLPKSNKSATIDVIVPIYSGLNETMRCLFSVITSEQKRPYNFIVINDCTPDEKIDEFLNKLSNYGLIELYKNKKNLGYVASCNLGMSINKDNDVILLNSDTEVFRDWIDRLYKAAHLKTNISTVTPLSNNAEICSYPYFLKNNYKQLEIPDDEIDEIASEVNADALIEIPTGVGFCMYVRRESINSLGTLNTEKFGKGYGEENDFCRRAAKAGWLNVLAPNIFVRHFGGISFGSEKNSRIENAVKMVESLHPGYGKLITDFIANDPVLPFRRNIDNARIIKHTKKNNILFVTHNWGGGTEKHILDLVDFLEKENIFTIFLHPDKKDESKGTLSSSAVDDTPNLISINFNKNIIPFAKTLKKLGVKHIHIHSFVNFSLVAINFIIAISKRLNIRYDYTVHDYHCICPRINLIDDTGMYCGEPETASCELCIEHFKSTTKTAVWLWRQTYERLLNNARKIFVPHEDVKIRLQNYFKDVDFTVRPHFELTESVSHLKNTPISYVNNARKVLLIGAIGQHKGSIILRDTAIAAKKFNFPLEFIVLGYTDRDDELNNIGNITILGRYNEGTGCQIASDINADLAWFPSIWPETFSFTLSMAFKCNLFSVCFDFGAIAARIHNLNFGKALPVSYMLHPNLIAKFLTTTDLQKDSSSIATKTIYSSVDSYYEFSQDNICFKKSKSCTVGLTQAQFGVRLGSLQK